MSSWKAAAVVSLLIVSTAALYYLLMQSGWAGFSSVTIQTEREVQTDRLPDGSVVTVNKNSRLTYPGEFAQNQREVTLLGGEAFFNVVPDQAKPFIVRVQDITVRVVGTSFNVKHGGGKTEVIVETGSVLVSQQSHQIRLQPREKVRVAAKNPKLVREQNKDQLYTYYRSNEFVANQTPLWRMVEVLNEAYDARIVIARKELRDLPLTTTFKNQSLDTILTVIKETLHLEVVKSGDQIILQ